MRDEMKMAKRTLQLIVSDCDKEGRLSSEETGDVLEDPANAGLLDAIYEPKDVNSAICLLYYERGIDGTPKDETWITCHYFTSLLLRGVDTGFKLGCPEEHEVLHRLLEAENPAINYYIKSGDYRFVDGKYPVAVVIDCTGKPEIQTVLESLGYEVKRQEHFSLRTPRANNG